jgi:hypothetical protein
VTAAGNDASNSKNNMTGAPSRKMERSMMSERVAGFVIGKKETAAK